MAPPEQVKSALIIGASRGLGLGLSLELLKRGWEVTATVRSAAGGTGLEAYHERVTMDTLDVNNLTMLDALAARMKAKTFDVVFINAGIGGPEGKTAADVAPEEIAHLFMTNTVAPVRLAGRLIGCVKPETGILAFMSSRLGSVTLKADPGMSLYSASKAALNSLTKSFVPAIADKSITVITMHPGWVRTDMGGSGADIDVETSVRGMANVLETQAGAGGHRFLNYKGEELPW
jgi:NAD(P)-dependent dehydrogenase (short-subunit alcohol dehydrogenase family)